MAKQKIGSFKRAKKMDQPVKKKLTSIYEEVNGDNDLDDLDELDDLNDSFLDEYEDTQDS